MAGIHDVSLISLRISTGWALTLSATSNVTANLAGVSVAHFNAASADVMGMFMAIVQ